MKNKTVISSTAYVFAPQVQNDFAHVQSLSLGDYAPAFKAGSTARTIFFPNDYAGEWVVMFGFPGDFTPVGETELKILASMTQEFEKMGAKLIGLSPNSKTAHQAWVNEVENHTGFLGLWKKHVNFPIVADEEMLIAQAYGMVHPNESIDRSIRSVIFIDPKGMVRAIFHYPIGTGRNFDEIMRVLQSLQMSDRNNVATAAQWKGSAKSGTTPLKNEYKNKFER